MKNIFLLEGCWFYRKDIIFKLKDSIKDYDLYHFDDKYSYEYVKQNIMELSCFGNKKIIIIDDIPTTKAPNKSQARTKVINYFQKLIPKIPDCNIVVFNDCISDRNKKFKSIVEEHGKVYSFKNNINKREATKFITDFFKKIDKDISFEDAYMISNSLNIDSDIIDMNNLILLIYKIRDYIGTKKKVSQSDILLICSQSREFITWNLFNSFDDKDFCISMELLNVLLDSAKNIESEIIKLILSIKWKYNLLIMIKNCIFNKMSKEEIISNISKLYKMERNGKGKRIKMCLKKENEENIPIYSNAMINSIFEGRDGRKSSLSCYSYKQLFLINYAIDKTFIKIRSGCTKHELMIPIEFLFLTICDKVKKIESLDILESKNLVTLEGYYDISI